MIYKFSIVLKYIVMISTSTLLTLALLTLPPMS